MSRAILSIFISLILVGCASSQHQQKFVEFQNWRIHYQQLAREGKVKWSSYYTEVFNRLQEFPSDPQKNLIQGTAAELIPLARKYESNQISKEEFEDTRRLVIAKFNQGTQFIQDRQQQINDIQAQQLYQLGNQIMQPRNPTTNCLTTRISPNTLSTNCN
jgi:hypothetical protein